MKQSVIGKGLLVLVVVSLLAIPGISSAKGWAPDISFDEPGSSSPEHLAVSSYRKAQVNLGLTDEDKVKNAIDTYFRLRYESQRLLEAQDFSFLIADGSQARQWAKNEQDKREIELFVALNYRLNYVEYEYFLDYKTVEVKDNDAIVRLWESHNVVFEVMAPQISKLGGLEHIITLHKSDIGWVIVDDQYQDELTQLMFNETKHEIIERVRRNREAELQHATQFTISNQKSEQTAINSGTWHSYNRTAAVSYADTWWNGRNPAWGNFDPPNGDGDCTNYISQVIYAGAPQMDDTGSYQWYYYNYWNRAPSWTDVSSLYTYLTYNTWTGPYGYNVSGPCPLQGGDVVQLHNGSYWSHSLVVVSTYYPNQCWDPSYVWYNAHYTDRYHYPLSYVSGYTKRYIQIAGWRD